MKIAIDARESGTSTGRYIDKLVEHLHTLQPQHVVVVLTKAERVSYFQKISPSFQIEVSDFKEFTLAEQLGFARQLYRLRADLVHFNAPQQPVLYLKPSITTIHDLTTVRFNNPAKFLPIYKLKQLVYKLVIHIVARRAKRIIAISNFVKQDLAAFTHVDEHKIDVIYEAADPITEDPVAVASLRGKQFIMYAGRPLPHKNLRRLIDAFSLLLANYPQLHLVLVGKKYGLYEGHAKYAHKRAIKNVIFTDFVSDGRLSWLYQNCQAYIVASLSEGFGLPGLEAMQAGAPVVSSDSTCLPEIYGPGALYFDPLDTRDMAEKIAAVVSDDKLRKNLIQAGVTVAKKYSWAQTAEQTLAVYNRVLTN